MLRNKRAMTLPSPKIFLTVINKSVHTPYPLDLAWRNFSMAQIAFLYQNDLNIQPFEKIAVLKINMNLFSMIKNTFAFS